LHCLSAELVTGEQVSGTRKEECGIQGNEAGE